MTFSFVLPRQPQAASSFPTSSFPATPVSLPFSLTASALGVDVKQSAPGLTCVWGWRNEKTGGESEDLGFAVENSCCWFTLFSGYRLSEPFGGYLIPVCDQHDRHQLHETFLSFHLNMGVGGQGDVHPSATPCALSVPFAHLYLLLEPVCCKISNVSISFHGHW